jgi:hypothetical protein
MCLDAKIGHRGGPLHHAREPRGRSAARRVPTRTGTAIARFDVDVCGAPAVLDRSTDAALSIRHPPMPCAHAAYGDKAKPPDFPFCRGLCCLWAVGGSLGGKKTPTEAEQPLGTIVDGHAPGEPPSPSIIRRRTPAAWGSSVPRSGVRNHQKFGTLPPARPLNSTSALGRQNECLQTQRTTSSSLSQASQLGIWRTRPTMIEEA